MRSAALGHNIIIYFPGSGKGICLSRGIRTSSAFIFAFLVTYIFLGRRVGIILSLLHITARRLWIGGFHSLQVLPREKGR